MSDLQKQADEIQADQKKEERMEARRSAGGKITQVNISSPLPKPDAADDD